LSSHVVYLLIIAGEVRFAEEEALVKGLLALFIRLPLSLPAPPLVSLAEEDIEKSLLTLLASLSPPPFPPPPIDVREAIEAEVLIPVCFFA
jgi:hypothetical protein